MSRKTITIDEGYIAYGFDRPLKSYFLQVYNYKGDLVHSLETPHIFTEGKVVNRMEIVEYLSNFNAPREHIKTIMLDLPFDEDLNQPTTVLDRWLQGEDDISLDDFITRAK